MSNSLSQAFRPPLYLADASVSYTADEFREAFDILTTPGRRDGSSLQVTQSVAPGMTVDVGVGAAVVAGTTNGAADAAGLFPQGLYGCRLDAAITGLPIPTAPTSGAARTDAVYLQIADKTVVGSGNNEAVVKVQSPYSTLPPSSLLLATVTVPVGATQILNTNIAANNTFAAPASQAIAVANLQAYYARSPRQGWFWGGTPYGEWVIPNGGWTTARGASQTINALAGHAYLISSTFTPYAHLTGPTNWRGSLQVNDGVIVEAFGTVIQVEAGGTTALGQSVNPVTLTRIWRCATSGSYTVATKFAADGVNSAGINQGYSAPYTEVTDLGLMA